MRKYLILIMLVFIFISCTSGKTEYFPSQGYSADVAEVTVIRKKRMFGLGFSMQVLLDGEVIARLKAGQYVTFFIDPGLNKTDIDLLHSFAIEEGQIVSHTLTITAIPKAPLALNSKIRIDV